MGHGRDREVIQRGRVYMAPPDRHLCIEAQYIRLSHGPRENWTRPAIDPMFRSAARTHGPSVIGILLTGHLHDGVNGLCTIHQCGGCTIVQDPSEALSPDMPRNALSRLKPTYILPLSEVPRAIGECLAQMCSLPKRAGAAHG
jgi:two-component system chemotaxis response regulator CheB